MTKVVQKFLQGRIYRSDLQKEGRRRGAFYRIEEVVSADLLTVTSFNPSNEKKKFNRRACKLSSLANYRMELLSYEEEPEQLQSVEGKRLRLERQRAIKAVGAKTSDGKRPERHDRRPRPVAVFLEAGTFEKVHAFQDIQQAEASARGNGEEVNVSEAIRRLVRMGLATWEARQTAKAAE